PSRAAVDSTRSRVASLTLWSLRPSTRETVAVDTPAAAATSARRTGNRSPLSTAATIRGLTPVPAGSSVAVVIVCHHRRATRAQPHSRGPPPKGTTNGSPQPHRGHRLQPRAL